MKSYKWYTNDTRSHHVQWPRSNTSARRANPFLAGCVSTPCWFVILIHIDSWVLNLATQPRHTFFCMAAFLKYSTAPGSPRDWSSRPNSIIASLKVASRNTELYEYCTHRESFAIIYVCFGAAKIFARGPQKQWNMWMWSGLSPLLRCLPAARPKARPAWGSLRNRKAIDFSWERTS